MLGLSFTFSNGNIYLVNMLEGHSFTDNRFIAGRLSNALPYLEITQYTIEVF